MNYRQQILAALQAKFKGGNAGVLGWIATQLAKTVTAPEQVQTAVDGISEEYVTMMEGYGDNRATSSAQTAVANYETRHKLKDGKPVEEPPTGGGDNKPVEQPKGGTTVPPKEEIPSWAKTLIEQNKALTERLDGVEKERTTSSRKSQLSAVIAKLPENLRKPYERISLDSLKDEEFTQLVSEVETEVTGILGSMRQQGAIFQQPTNPQGGGTGVKATDTEVDEVVNMLNI